MLATGACVGLNGHPPRALTELELRAAVEELPLGAAAGVVVAAGDIAHCDRLEHARATAALAEAVVGAAPAALVITMGDHAYPRGTALELERCYDPTWGAFNDMTYPSPGNHDFETDDGAPYFAYFRHYARDPDARARGYYAFERFGWHFVSLNSLLPLERGSEQLAWLEAELARAATACTLAYWHHPLVSSGWHGLSPWDAGRDTSDAWRVLMAFGAELAVNGHEHFYERFDPQTADLAPHPQGIRQIVAGTGGAELTRAIRSRPQSAVVHEGHGVLVLSLRPGTYEWAFVGVDGAIHDRSDGPVACHGAPPERAAIAPAAPRRPRDSGPPPRPCPPGLRERPAHRD